MVKRWNDNQEREIKTGRVEDGCARYGVGRNTMRKMAEEAGAVVRVGKCWLINFSVMDAYMDSITEERRCSG